METHLQNGFLRGPKQIKHRFHFQIKGTLTFQNLTVIWMFMERETAKKQQLSISVFHICKLQSSAHRSPVESVPLKQDYNIYINQMCSNHVLKPLNIELLCNLVMTPLH